MKPAAAAVMMEPMTTAVTFLLAPPAAAALAAVHFLRRDPIIPIILGVALILLVLGRRYFREKK